MNDIKGQEEKKSKETTKKEKFIRRIVREAIVNVRETYAQSGKKGTILKYKEKDYKKIQTYLEEINCQAERYNIAVQLDNPQLGQNEVRFYYID